MRGGSFFSGCEFLVRRQNTLLQKMPLPPNEPPEKIGVSCRRDASLIRAVDSCSAQVGSAGLGLAVLGSALPPKVGVSRRRNSILSKTVASRVDETTLAFGSMRFA